MRSTVVVVIRIRGLTKDFARGDRTVHAVRGLDLDIAPGELVAVLGPNGAGKSTTMRMLTTLIAPTTGRAEVERLHGVHRAVATGEVLGESPGADRCHTENATTPCGHFLSAMKLLPACGRRWLMDRTDGTLVA